MCGCCLKSGRRPPGKLPVRFDGSRSTRVRRGWDDDQPPQVTYLPFLAKVDFPCKINSCSLVCRGNQPLRKPRYSSLLVAGRRPRAPWRERLAALPAVPPARRSTPPTLLRTAASPRCAPPAHPSSPSTPRPAAAPEGLSQPAKARWGCGVQGAAACGKRRMEARRRMGRNARAWNSILTLQEVAMRADLTTPLLPVVTFAPPPPRLCFLAHNLPPPHRPCPPAAYLPPYQRIPPCRGARWRWRGVPRAARGGAAQRGREHL